MCNKRRYAKIEAMLILAKCIMKSHRKRKYTNNRDENRYYYCKICKAYHLTSRAFKSKKIHIEI